MYLPTQISFSAKQRYYLHAPTYTNLLLNQERCYLQVNTYTNLLNQAMLLPKYIYLHKSPSQTGNVTTYTNLLLKQTRLLPKCTYLDKSPSQTRNITTYTYLPTQILLSTRNCITYTYIPTQISISTKQRDYLHVSTYTNIPLNQTTFLPTRTKLWLWFLTWEYMDSLVQ